MDFFEWVGFKIILLIAVITGLMFIIFWAGSGLTLLFGIENLKIIMAVELTFLTVVSALLLILFHDNLPEEYEIMEEEIIDELIIHEEPIIFRVSIVLALNILFVFCRIYNITWIFQIGIFFSCTVIILYIIDFIASIYINGLDGIYEMIEDSTLQNILILVISLIVLFLCLFLSNVKYKGITYDALIKEELQKNKEKEQSSWDKFKTFLQNLQNKVDNSIAQNKADGNFKLENFPKLEEQINVLLKRSNLEDLKVWLKKQNQTNNKEIKQFTDLLLKKVKAEEKKRRIK